MNLGQSWESLGKALNDSTKECIKDLKFSCMTPVQAACIPQFLKHKDVAVEAVTGSGKTIAFVIPIMEILLRREEPLGKFEIGAVVLSPARELALQIYDVMCHFSKAAGFTVQLLTGGRPIEEDVAMFKKMGSDILVATPGRLNDLFERRTSSFDLTRSVKSLEVLILDEADRLLDQGFKQTLTCILQRLPKQRRTGLFSATQTEDIQDLIRAGLRNPISIRVSEKVGASCLFEKQKTPEKLHNYYMIVPGDQKLNQVVKFLRDHRQLKIMVFFSTCASAEYFYLLFQNLVKNVEILRLHRKLEKKRNKIFGNFSSLKSGILVCTDVMARGVDFPAIDWVVQFDPPNSASAFVHRCGRTARIGNAGSALLFVQPSEDSYIKFLELQQNVHLLQLSMDLDAVDVTLKVQKLCAADRALYIGGLRSFVSFIRSYSKHECGLIFQLKELDMGRTAVGFGLVHLPRMNELHGRDTSAFKPLMVSKDISFRDKAREKVRQKNLKEGKVKKVKYQPKAIPWSKQNEKMEKRKKRLDLKERKRKRQEENIVNPPKEEVDIDELDRDVKLLKRLKKGKITERDFAKEVGISSDEEV